MGNRAGHRGGDRGGPRVHHGNSRLPVRGNCVAAGRQHHQGHLAAQPVHPAEAAGQRHGSGLLRRGCSQPRRRPGLDLRGHAVRGQGDRRDQPAVPAGQHRHRRTQPDRLGAAAGRLDPQRPDARAAHGTAAPPRDPPRPGTDAGHHGPGRRRRAPRRPAGQPWPRCWPGPPTPRPTSCSPRATRTSIPPGCGRSGRPCASAPGRSPTWSPSWTSDPDFVFSCSSAQQLAWIKEFYPELFGRIREKVKAGQFVPVGGMWVESDTNMPGGEAMARQFLEGKSSSWTSLAWIARKPGCRIPSATQRALPQIVKAAGSQWFLTQKISWNQINRMPHHTFNWEGIDGTRLFTHFPPVDTYNSELSGRELAHAERNYRDHGRGTISLVPFGYGDGGGGPTREMLAAAHRTADLEGSPEGPDRHCRAASSTQAQAEYTSLPVWVGEMYLELHRGTYTSQAKTKQGNRRSEHLLREAELWCATAAVRTAGGLRLPGGRTEAPVAAGPAAAVPRHPARQLHRVGAPGRRTELRRRRGMGLEAIIARRRARRTRGGQRGVPAQRRSARTQRRSRAGRRRTRPERPSGRGDRVRTAASSWTTASSGPCWTPTDS